MTHALPSGSPLAHVTRAAARWDSTHAGLIEAATDLFRRFGVHATSIGDVVAAANLTKPTLYRHFPSKEALVVACLREEGRRTRLALSEAVEPVGNDSRRRIRAIGDHFAAQFGQAPSRGLFALNLAVEYSEPGSPVHAAIRAEIEGLQAQLARLIAPGASGDARPVAHRLALAIFGASAACQALGVVACDNLAESVESLVAECCG